jgi:pectinesterase
MAPAVAALVGGDRSSFYGCGFISVQDTLSDMYGRHYYENCYIEGSTDFIFGNGQSLFQVQPKSYCFFFLKNCHMLPLFCGVC